MTVFEHKFWDELLPYLYIRVGMIGENGKRERIEVHHDVPQRIIDGMRTTCEGCRTREIQNIRLDKRGALTFNVSCSFESREEGFKCARKPGVSPMCDRVRDAIKALPKAQTELF